MERFWVSASAVAIGVICGPALGATLDLRCAASDPGGGGDLRLALKIDPDSKSITVHTVIDQKGVKRQETDEHYIDGRFGPIFTEVKIDVVAHNQGSDEMARRLRSLLLSNKMSQHVSVTDDAIRYGADGGGQSHFYIVDRSTGEMKIEGGGGPPLQCSRNERKF